MKAIRNYFWSTFVPPIMHNKRLDSEYDFRIENVKILSNAVHWILFLYQFLILPILRIYHDDLLILFFHLDMTDPPPYAPPTPWRDLTDDFVSMKKHSFFSIHRNINRTSAQSVIFTCFYVNSLSVGYGGHGMPKKKPSWYIFMNVCPCIFCSGIVFL